MTTISSVVSCLNQPLMLGRPAAFQTSLAIRSVGAASFYVVPTFALGFVWHLILFKSYYDALAMYREDVIIPFGLLSMLIQAVLFAWIYDKSFSGGSKGWLRDALGYAALGAALSWSFTTIAVAAKNVMTSVSDYLLIETAFTAVQWTIVGPLTAWVYARTKTASL